MEWTLRLPDKSMPFYAGTSIIALFIIMMEVTGKGRAAYQEALQRPEMV